MVQQADGARFRGSDLPPGKVPVMFTADWCGYCHRFLPHFKRFRDAWVVDVTDEDLPIWDDLGIRVVPTVILYEDGIPGKRWSGVLGARHADEIQASLSGDPPVRSP